MRICPHYVVAIKTDTSAALRLQCSVHVCVLCGISTINGGYAVRVYRIQSKRDIFTVPAPVGIKGC